jgi:GGDEF domain-containing protein
VAFATSLLLMSRARQRRDDLDSGRQTIPSFRRSRVRLEEELSRVRRYDHPLAVMVVKVRSRDIDRTAAALLAGGNGNGSALARHWHRVVSLHVGTVFYDCLRSSDLPTWDLEHDQYVVCLPESDEAQALQAADRLRRLVPEYIGASVASGVAEFPHVNQATQRCESHSQADASLEMAEADVIDHNSVDRQAQSR